MVPVTEYKMRRKMQQMGIVERTPLRANLENKRPSGHVTRHLLRSAGHGMQESSYVATHWVIMVHFSHPKRERESGILFIPKCVPLIPELKRQRQGD